MYQIKLLSYTDSRFKIPDSRFQIPDSRFRLKLRFKNQVLIKYFLKGRKVME